MSARRSTAARREAGKKKPKSKQTVTEVTCDSSFSASEQGLGTFEAPLRLPLRASPNGSGCFHCPTSRCDCVTFTELFDDAAARVNMKRVVEVSNNRAMCAKSLNACFVARLRHLLDVREGDVFYDLGSGNGSILFQMALLTGARCVGVELSEHNAEVSRQIWSVLKPQLESTFSRSMPDVSIITGDISDAIMDSAFESDKPLKILTSNLVMPRSLTHFMSERFRRLAVGSRIACFDDLYPHSRPSAQSRDPEAFRLFKMTDCVWPEFSVEWCAAEGRFYIHERV